MNLQQKIFKKLLEVPKGQITTYGELSKAVGMKNGQRAVGKINEQKSLPCNNSLSPGCNVYWKSGRLCIW